MPKSWKVTKVHLFFDSWFVKNFHHTLPSDLQGFVANNINWSENVLKGVFQIFGIMLYVHFNDLWSSHLTVIPNSIWPLPGLSPKGIFTSQSN